MIPRSIPVRHAPAGPAKPKRPLALESPVQREALKLIAMAGFQGIHTPNGAFLAGGRLARVKQMARLKADGLRPGFPDLTIMGPAPRIGFMEAKREGGTDDLLSEDQRWWRDWLQGNGWNYWFLNRPEDVFVAFRAWGWR
jgi:hypothetical protein